MQSDDSLEKDPDAWRDWRQKRATEDEMVGWHHRFNGHEHGWTPGDGEGQGGLVCCGPWGCKEWDTTERLNLLIDLNLILDSMLCYAKSLQSCPTLCDPIDGSPPGSAVPGILQARTLEWVAISFSNAWKGKVKVKSLSRVQLLATQWTAAYQPPPWIFQARVLEWVATAFSTLDWKKQTCYYLQMIRVFTMKILKDVHVYL